MQPIINFLKTWSTIMKKLFILLLTIILPATAFAAPAVIDYYAPAMQKMHMAMMAVKPTGNADVDFVQGMLPHHQGAVDMAKIELQYGKDPAIRKLAADIIAAQESEIKMMNAWLAAHPQK
jgi:uncharacterized protein (DUF305 family)